MNKEILRIKPKSFELSESNDIFMLLTMCILSNQNNLNDAHFTDDYIAGVISNKDRYVGIPLQVNRTKLENGNYTTLSHELDKKTGELKTDSIGSFVDFWEETDIDGSKLLMGSIKVYKRYPAVCEALIDLYNSGDLEFSCEVMVYGYESVENSVRKIAYEYEGQVNSLFASCVVSYPAEIKSKAFTLVAEALEKDLKGGESLSQPTTEVFNKGQEIRYHGNFEVASLKYTQISDQIYNMLNPINPKTNDRQYNYWVSDLYTDYVVVEEWYDYENLWKIPYSIVNDVVVLAPDSEWVKGSKGFIPDGVSIDTLLAEKESLSAKLASQVAELNEQHKEANKLTEEQIKELQDKVTELSGKVTELEGTIVAQAGTIKTHEEKETELASEIETLKPFKEKVEVSEKEAKKTVIVEKFSKILSKEVMESELVVNAIEALDEVALNGVVVEQVTKELASKQPENKDEPVVVVASKQGNLIPENVLQKYGLE